MVADDDQAIYRWRGASYSNITYFTEAYPGARIVVLTQNYRSTQLILDSAYRLIRHNDPDRLEVRQRIDKRLRAVSGVGVLPRHLHFDTLHSEADGVADRIAQRVAAGQWRYTDVAILVRANRDADPFMRALNLRGIPFVFSGTRGLYDREEIRLVVAALRCIADPHDSLSLYLLSAAPFYGVAVAPDGMVWASVLGFPGALVRLDPGSNPSETALAEYYELPWDNPKAPNVGFSPRGMDVDRNGVVWTPLASGHLASFDRRKCEGPLNGPTATGQHCPEGWTFYQEPIPQFQGVTSFARIRPGITPTAWDQRRGRSGRSRGRPSAERSWPTPSRRAWPRLARGGPAGGRRACSALSGASPT